ncbi:MAG: hypothetical protein AAFV45_15035 [Pseudomonadota bacterium]
MTDTPIKEMSNSLAKALDDLEKIEKLEAEYKVDEIDEINLVNIKGLRGIEGKFLVHLRKTETEH